MTGTLLRAAALASAYLLVLSSVAPGDVVVGGVLGLVVARALHPSQVQRAAPRWAARLSAAMMLFAQGAVEMVVGSWRVVRFCLGARASPGLVELPRGDRSRLNVAMWGLLVGESPDEVIVDFDRHRNVLIVHVLDARDPETMRSHHRSVNERWLRKVVP